MNSIQMKMSLCFLPLILLFAGITQGQDSPKSMLSLARKQTALAKGLDDQEKEVIYKKAIALYLQVPAKWPEALREQAKANLEVAILQKRMGDLEGAILSLKKVTSMDELPASRADAFLALASIYRKKKDLAAAETCLLELLEKTPNESKDCAKARLTLGSIAKARKQYIDAMQYGQDVLEKHQDQWRANVDAIQLQLSILIKCYQWDEARTQLGTLDQLVRERFAGSNKAESVEKALSKLPARRILTPIPVANH